MSSINSLIIKERRKALGMSQEALANKLGVSKVAICWYETGERTPTMENFLKLADILLDRHHLIGTISFFQCLF